jgi:antibiotic biosynthesis monooxygenase (ABM) superfamily enzyme
VDGPVTTTVVHDVAPGREAEFYVWATGLLRRAKESPDFLGGGVLGPAEDGGEWHVVYRWVDQDSAQRWESAADRAGWTERAESFSRPKEVQRVTGLRAWLDNRARTTPPPPKWKMALVTLGAVFPPVLLFNVTLIPYLGDFSVVLRTLALCVGVTVVVTYVMMPRLTRLLKGWLQPAAAQSAPAAPERAAPKPEAARQDDDGPQWREAGPPPQWLDEHPRERPEQPWERPERPWERPERPRERFEGARERPQRRPPERDHRPRPEPERYPGPAWRPEEREGARERRPAREQEPRPRAVGRVRVSEPGPPYLRRKLG